jgi:hypothetical protein
MSLVFDPVAHVYRFNGEKKISVTEAFGKAGLVDTRWFKPEHALRGKAVHEACNLFIRDDLDEKSLHPIVIPYFKAFKKALRNSIFDWHLDLCEKPMYHSFYDYAGTADIVCKKNRKNALIDIKTGFSSCAAMQTAAYEQFPEVRKLICDRYTLKLNANETFEWIQHRDNFTDFQKFLCALKKAREISEIPRSEQTAENADLIYFL